RTGGKKVFELRPQLPWDKGKAVAWLIEALGLAEEGVVPIYIGDDETDEDAFMALRERGGIGLFVGDTTQDTAASYRLSDTVAVGHFLSRLADVLGDES
ncbi:trehalose-phosphatase, partial [Halomonas sp. BBD45]